MNLDATIGSVKALSSDDMAEHLRAIDAHRKSIARHVVGIQAHLKSMLNFDDEDDTDDADDVDDPLLDDEDDDDKAAFVAELKQLAEEVAALTAT
jgi:hypothetical protein